MKKHTLLLWIAFIAFALTSCESNTPGQKMIVKTLDLTVLEKDWKFDANTSQFYYHFEVPEVTAYAYNYGTWTLNREYNYGTKDAFQVALPLSLYLTDTVVDPIANDTTVYYYTQHIDYLVGIGFVEVQLTNSDYEYAPGNPELMRFRFQLIY